MSKNIEQIYTGNPSTTMATTDLLYKGISPYGPTDDSAIQYGDFQTGIQITETQVTGLTADLASKLNLSGGTMTGNLILNGNPSTANQAANKAYVDAVASGIIIQPSMASATINNLTATYNNGTAGVGATLTNSGTQAALVIDNYTVLLNDNILVKNQTAAADNGWYTATNLGSISTNWVLTRSTSYDTNTQIKPGDLFAINNGLVNANSSWLQTATVNTVGTDSIQFSLFTNNPADFLMVANNLSDVQSPSASRTNLGVAIGSDVEAWSAVLDTVSAGTYTGSTSITTLGTISTGTWDGTIVSPTFGGTGVNNGAHTFTYAGNVAFSGAFTFTGTLTNNTAVTFPISGVLATTSQLPTASALTEVNDTNVTLTLGGSPSTALLAATSITAGWNGQLSLARGGTNASLTASNGGMIYSTASAFAVLAGTATAGQPLLSGASGAPTWGSVTLPSSTTANDILFSSSNNVIGQISTGNNGTLITSGTGVPSISSTLPAAVQGNITTVGTITSGTWTGTNIALANGGTSASLTASNGGIIYSSASAMAVLAGTATADRVLLSGASTTPSWSTATYPVTTTANDILYSSAANTISQISTSNSSVLVTSSGGVPSLSTTLPASLTIPTPNIGGLTGGSFSSSGNIGQLLSVGVPIGSAVPLTSSVFAQIASLSIPAGCWQLNSNIVLYDSGATAVVQLGYGFMNTAVTFGNQYDAGFIYPINLATTPAQPTFVVPTLYEALTTTTTFYLIAFVEFSAGAALAAYGKFTALRVA